MREHYYLDPVGLFTSISLMIGGVLWITTYILIIRKSFKDTAYGIPMFAICLNITWEMIELAACVPGGDPLGLCPQPSGGTLLHIAEKAGVFVDVAWFGLDCVLIYQLFKFGRALEPTKQIREHWVKVLVSTLVLAFLLQYGFATMYQDTFLIRDAWIINMIMSVSFLFLLFERESLGLRGLSLPAAWTKLGGNLFYAIGLIIVHNNSIAGDNVANSGAFFMYVLFASTFVFDVLYLVYLKRAMQGPADDAVPAGAVAA